MQAVRNDATTRATLIEAAAWLNDAEIWLRGEVEYARGYTGDAHPLRYDDDDPARFTHRDVDRLMVGLRVTAEKLGGLLVFQAEPVEAVATDTTAARAAALGLRLVQSGEHVRADNEPFSAA